MKVLFLVPPNRYKINVARDLVYGCWCKGRRVGGISFPPITLLTVATILKQEGTSVELIDAAAKGISTDELGVRADEFDFVVVLTSSMTLNEDCYVLNELKKKNKNLKTIAFGIQVTVNPESALKRGIDIVVRNEAEYVIRNLIKASQQSDDSWKNVRGISYKLDGKIAINKDYPPIEDLDKLPIPERKILPKDIIYYNPVVKRMPFTTMFTSRGCSHMCVFCGSPTFYGKTVRFQSPDRVLKELREIQNLGYKEVFFRDENFTISRKRVLEICRGINEMNIDLKWISSTRVDLIDEEMMRVMKTAGCHMIRLGVESGNQDLLDNIKKEITIEQIRDTFRCAHNVSLDTHAHVMLGLPGETKETLKNTMQFIKEINPTIVTYGIITAFPGTMLFESISKDHPEIGDGTSCDLSRLHTESFFNEFFTRLTAEELRSYVRKAYMHFYMRPSYIFKQLKRIQGIDELKRVAQAGLKVFGFISGRG